MATKTPSPTQLIHAYRHLYKALLYTVRYSKPNRYIVRDELRDAFRRSDSSSFNEERIARTLEFIQGAGRERGIENKILKNLCQIEHMRREMLIQKMYMSKRVVMEVKEMSFQHYNNTIAMLNDSMGLCLPTH